MHLVSLAVRLLFLLATSAVASGGSKLVGDKGKKGSHEAKAFPVQFRYKAYDAVNGRAEIGTDHLVMYDDGAFKDDGLLVPFEGLRMEDDSVHTAGNLVLAEESVGRVVQCPKAPKGFRVTLTNALDTFRKRREEEAREVQRQKRQQKLEERRKREEEERKRREHEEEIERQRLEEVKRKEREQLERERVKKREEEDRIRKQLEEARKEREEQERREREEQERREREERERREREERERREREEQERREREEQERREREKSILQEQERHEEKLDHKTQPVNRQKHDSHDIKEGVEQEEFVAIEIPKDKDDENEEDMDEETLIHHLEERQQALQLSGENATALSAIERRLRILKRNRTKRDRVVVIPILTDLNEKEDIESEQVGEKGGKKTSNPRKKVTFGDDPFGGIHHEMREEQRDILTSLSRRGSVGDLENLKIYHESSEGSSGKGLSLNILYESTQLSGFLNSGSLKSLAGVPINRNRVSVLRQAYSSKLQSRTPHDFFISTVGTERELLTDALKKSQNVMCQATISSYERLFPRLGGASLKNSFAALPIASLYRDHNLGCTLPQVGEEYLNEDGTGLLVKLLVESPGIISGLESDGNVLVFTNAAIFEAPKEKGSTEYTMPPTATADRANFVISQKLDMAGMSKLEWRLHRDQIGLYITMYYEAVYMAAIVQKADAVLLTSILSEATQEQYAYMLGLLLRVHQTLSPYLNAAQITIVMPSGLENFDYESFLSPQNVELSKGGAEILLDRGVLSENDSRIIEPLPLPKHFIEEDKESDEYDVEEEEQVTKNPVLMEVEFTHGTGMNVYLDEDAAPLLLSNYLRPQEDKRRAELTPTALSIGNAKLLNTNIIINTIRIEGSRN